MVYEGNAPQQWQAGGQATGTQNVNTYQYAPSYADPNGGYMQQQTYYPTNQQQYYAPQQQQQYQIAPQPQYQPQHAPVQQQQYYLPEQNQPQYIPPQQYVPEQNIYLNPQTEQYQPYQQQYAAPQQSYGNTMQQGSMGYGALGGKSIYGRLDLGYAMLGDTDMTAKQCMTSTPAVAVADNLGCNGNVVPASMDGGLGYGAGLGFYWLYNNFNLRFDATVAMISSDFDGKLQDGTDEGSVDSLSLMGNAYLDFANHNWQIGSYPIIPYIGAGIGMAQNETDTLTVITQDFATVDVKLTQKGEKVTSLAWMLSAGLNILLNPDWMLDFQYKYLNLGTMETGKDLVANDLDGSGLVYPNVTYQHNGLESDLSGHELSLGLRYHF